MTLYTKESLEVLRSRIDLVEVVASHIDLKSAGGVHKACCPFHDEKTPSFIIYKGETNYHCFGCGAHGDAIAFLMNFSHVSFTEAIETLALRFSVHLEPASREKLQDMENQTENKSVLKTALQEACHFYHFCLLYTPEGHNALKYLYERGIDLDFILQFQIGWASTKQNVLWRYLQSKQYTLQTMQQAGLILQGKNGSVRDFFCSRITFPIYNALGNIIGFSARKYQQEVFGGKYINTAETVLFKKSKILFGLNYCRKRIAKEGKVLIVEGQVDALRLIQKGLNITVASLGTAFGQDHVQELVHLGVKEIYLGFDGDTAGQEASKKIGHLFQKQSIEVFVLNFAADEDPDTILNKRGLTHFLQLLAERRDYLTFLLQFLQTRYDITSPAGKNELIKIAVEQVRSWDHPLMVHESLKKISSIMDVPEDKIGIGPATSPQLYTKNVATLSAVEVNPHRVLESDLLRWLFLLGDSRPDIVELAQQHIYPDHFHTPICRRMYIAYMHAVQTESSLDLLSIVSKLQDVEGQLFLVELLQKKVNKERMEIHFVETLQKILEKDWLMKREMIKTKIYSGQCSEEETLELVKEFDILTKQSPMPIHLPAYS